MLRDSTAAIQRRQCIALLFCTCGVYSSAAASQQQNSTCNTEDSQVLPQFEWFSPFRPSLLLPQNQWSLIFNWIGGSGLQLPLVGGMVFLQACKHALTTTASQIMYDGHHAVCALILYWLCLLRMERGSLAYAWIESGRQSISDFRNLAAVLWAGLACRWALDLSNALRRWLCVRVV